MVTDGSDSEETGRARRGSWSFAFWCLRLAIAKHGTFLGCPRFDIHHCKHDARLYLVKLDSRTINYD